LKNKTVLILAGVLVPLLLAEVFLRVSGFGQIRPELRFDPNTRAALAEGHYSTDKHLFWKRGDTPLTEQEKRIRYLRPGDPVPAKSGRFRIICLGDSCTKLALAGLPYSALLQQGLGTRQVEVFNASLPGYTSYQGLVWLKRELLDLQPNLVIVYFGWNDHWRNLGNTDRDYAASLQGLRLLSLFRGKEDPPPFRVPVEEFKENLREMARLVNGAGGKTLFLVPPAHLSEEAKISLEGLGNLLPGDDPIRIHQEYQQAVRVLVGLENARVLDVAQIFEEAAEYEMLLHRDGVHPTDLGHIVLAELLQDDIGFNYLGGTNLYRRPAALALSTLAQAVVFGGDWAKGIDLYRRSLQKDQDWLQVRLGLAWILAACPVDSLRDGQEALALLEGQEPAPASPYHFLAVQAVALAETGQFDRAVTSAQEALASLTELGGGESEIAQGIRDRLALFEARQPFRLPVTESTVQDSAGAAATEPIE
jgi:lysophospholipase L1-like esterase